MDPLSILGGVAGLITTALHYINTYNGVRGRVSTAAITIASMKAQCSSINFAVLQIQDLIIQNPQGIFSLRSGTRFANHFTTVFGACQLVFSVVNQRFQELLDDSVNRHGEMTRGALMRFVWDDGEMNNLLRSLDSQAGAINLLLSALQIRSNAELHDFLNNEQSLHVLGKAADDAGSLATSNRVRDRSSGFKPSYCSSIDEVEFSFDFEIINTTAYRRAFASRSATKLAPRIEAQNAAARNVDYLPKIDQESIAKSEKGGESRLEELPADRKVSETSSTTLIGSLANQLDKDMKALRLSDEGSPILGKAEFLQPGISPASTMRTTAIKRKPVNDRQIIGNELKDASSIRSDTSSEIISSPSRDTSRPTTPFDQYTIGILLQEQWRCGSIQRVFSVKRFGLNEKLSMKLIPRTDSQTKPLTAAAQLKDIYWEIGVLRKLEHRNIACIHEFIENDESFGICMKYDSDKTLTHFTTDISDVSLPARNDLVNILFQQLSSAVLYLHQNGTVHCDLTLENIIYSEDEVKITITNFSMAKTVDLKKKRRPSSADDGKTPSLVKYASCDLPFMYCSFRDKLFAAPELLKKPKSPRRKKSQFVNVEAMTLEAGKIDVYSCGVVLFSMLFGKLPYTLESIATRKAPVYLPGQFSNTRSIIEPGDDNIQFDSWTPPRMKMLIQRMLDVDPQTRFDIVHVQDFLLRNVMDSELTWRKK